MSTSFKSFVGVNSALANVASSGLSERLQSLKSLADSVVAIAQDLPVRYGRAYSQNQWMKYDSDGNPDDLTPPQQVSASESVLSDAKSQINTLLAQEGNVAGTPMSIDVSNFWTPFLCYKTDSNYLGIALEYKGGKFVIRRQADMTGTALSMPGDIFQKNFRSSTSFQFTYHGSVFDCNLQTGTCISIKTVAFIKGYARTALVLSTPYFVVILTNNKSFLLTDLQNDGAPLSFDADGNASWQQFGAGQSYSVDSKPIVAQSTPLTVMDLSVIFAGADVGLNGFSGPIDYIQTSFMSAGSTTGGSYSLQFGMEQVCPGVHNLCDAINNL